MESMIHPDVKLAIELRYQAYELETQANGIKQAANDLIAKHIKEGEDAKHPDESYGSVVVCKSSSSSKFDKAIAKIKLVELGAPAAAVVKAFQLATTTSEKSGGIKYYPWKDKGKD